MNKKKIGTFTLFLIVLTGVLFWSIAFIGLIRFPSADGIYRSLRNYLLFGLTTGWISLFLLGASLYKEFKKRSSSNLIKLLTLVFSSIFVTWLGFTLLAFSSFS